MDFETNAQEPLFPQTPEETQPDTSVGNYTYLKGMGVLATGEQPEEEKVNFNTHLHKIWAETVPYQNQLSAQILSNPIDINMVETEMTNIRLRQQMIDKAKIENQAELRFQLAEVAKESIENLLYRNYVNIEVNTPEQVDKIITEGVQELSAKTALEKIIEDGNSAWSIAKGFGYEFTALAAVQGIAIDDVAKKYDVDNVNFLSGRSETRAKLQLVYRNLDEKDKGQWLTNLYNDLTNSTYISKWQAAFIAMEVAGPEDVEIGGLDDWLDRLGVVGTVAGWMFAAGKAIKLFKSSREILNTEHSLAKVGGKNEIARGETAKLVGQVARKQQLQAVGAVAGELSGISAAIDLGKLVSMSASKLLPTSVKMASQDFQAILTKDVDDVIAALKETQSAKNIRPEEVQAALRNLEAQYSPVKNPNIHTIDPFTTDGTFVKGRVVYKPATSNSFLTEKAASEFIKNIDPRGVGNFRVVPDTTNTKFYVEETVVKELELKKAALEAELIKAAKKTVEEKVSVNGLKVTNLAPSIGKTVTGQSAVTTTAPVKKAVSRETLTSALEQAGKNNKLLRQGNVAVGVKNAQVAISEFTVKMGAALGLDGRKITVITRSDLLGSGNKSVSSRLQAEIDAAHSGAKGVHFAVGPNESVIYLAFDVGDTIKQGKTVRKATLTDVMDTLAHEYGHAFEAAFEMKYASAMRTAFQDWLKTKGLKLTSVVGGQNVNDIFPMEALLEYRSLRTTQDMSEWIDDWMGGNYEHYLKLEKNIHQWASKYSEFFAENFAKWAFTDEVPTTILGQAFAKLVVEFKKIAQAVYETLRFKNIAIAVDANKQIARMLNRHVELVKQGKITTEQNLSRIASESAGAGRSIDSMATELNEINLELEAIKGARDGARSGYLVEQNITETVTYDRAITEYADDDINSASTVFTADRALATSSELYTNRLTGIMQQSRYQKLLTNFVRKDVESLNRVEKSKLTDVLVKGDKEGKVFSDTELAGMQLNSKTRNAYFRVRALRDIMHQIRNDVAAKSLTRRGFSQLNLKNSIEGQTVLFAKEASLTKGMKIFDQETNQFVAVSDDVINNVNNGTYRAFEMPDAITTGDKSFTRILIKREDVEVGAVKDAIPYRKGEFRRIYSDEYFIKIDSARNIDGEVKNVKAMTHRTAVSRGEADKYIKNFSTAIKLHKEGNLTRTKASELLEQYGWNPDEIIAQLDNEAFGIDPKVYVVYNRTDDDWANTQVGMSSNFASQRGDRVLSIYGDDTVNTVNPMDAIAAEIGNTAAVASSHEWRESHVIRWFQSFQDILPRNVKEMSPEDAFRYMLNNKGAYLALDKRGIFAKQVQDYIMSQMNIATKEEQAMIGFTRKISEWFEGGSTNKAILKTGLAMRSTQNYTQWARTFAFHSYFGLNPVQFVMQGMNTFNAIAISPIHGLKAAKTALFYSMALASDQEVIWRKIAQANNFTNLGLGMSVDEFVETIRMLKRSGLLDGMNTSSLYGASTGTYGLFNKWRRRGSKVSAAPFNAGEGLSRIVSFDIARREWMAANKGGAFWTDDALSTMLRRQDDLTQNMTMANQNWWQRGILSIPMQFTQYQIKIAMSLLSSIGALATGKKSRTFTGVEAVQLLIMHSLMMGTSGTFLWPFRDIVTNMFPEDMTQDEAITAQQGLIAGLISHVTDGQLKLAVGTRFGTFAYYEQIIDGFMNPEKNWLEVLGGPGGFAALRLFGGVGKAWDVFVANDLTPASLQEAAKVFATSTLSSFSNAEKARVMFTNYNIAYSSSGSPLYTLSDYEVYAKALGFTTVAEADLTALYTSKRRHDDDIKNAAKNIRAFQLQALTALKNKDEASYEVYKNVVKMILNTYTGQDRIQLQKQLFTGWKESKVRELILDQAINQWQVQDLVVNTDKRD